MTQENDNSPPASVKTLEKATPEKKTARKTPAKKPSAAKSTVTAASAPEKTAEKKTVEKTALSETGAAAKEKKTAPKKTAAAKKPAAAKKTAVAKPEEESSTNKAGAKKTAAKASQELVKTAAKKPVAETAKQEPLAKEDPRKLPQEQPKELPQEQSREAQQEQQQEQPQEHSQEQSLEQPRSSSRRSRRGGRRRNKKTAQSAVEGPNAQSAVEDPNALSSVAGSVIDAEEAAPENAVIDAEDGVPANKSATEAAAPEKNVAKTQAAKKTAAAKERSSVKESTPPKGKNAKDAAVKETAVKVEAEPAKSPSGKRKMFISVLSGELVEVVLAEEGLVQEYYVEMQHQAKVKGNIYKGVVSNIDANLQAAFISYAGGVKNGFLQIDEVHPEYYSAHYDPAKGRKYPPIQKVLKPGQEILVQVVKEPAGTKGAFLTSYLSLPGRFLVLTPGREQIGVSRKVESDAERVRLRSVLDGLSLGEGLGVIVRTVSTGASKTSLTRDLQFLKRLWKEVRAKGQAQPSPSLVYEELDLSTRAVRDYLTDDVQEVWVDDEQTAKQVMELASLLFPKKQNLVQVHCETGHSLFERFSLQKQLDQIHSREASLPSGGRLVIDNTEALTAIDINSGRSSGKTNFEDMAFRTNLEAAKAIPSQLRLRDIGGQVVVDFIEMRDRDHWREVEKAIRNGMKGDRARYDVGKIGPFGMLEIVRQRLGSSAISVSTEPCPCCKGTGIRRNMEWQAMQSLRDMGRALRAAAANNQTNLTYSLDTELAFYLLNTKRSILQKMEEESGVAVAIRPAGE